VGIPKHSTRSELVEIARRRRSGWLPRRRGLSPSTTIVAVERPDGAGNDSRAASYEYVRLPDGGKFPDRRACVFRTVGNFRIAGVCASNGRSSWAL
jgi:hypothetical protein